ncbi:TPA: integron integrase [Escherichia coli]|nr:integron integrase [Escherichia coli]HCT2521719.1 integron integrase [Escherichia coli]
MKTATAPLPPLRSVKVLDQLRERIRYLHYSLRTEQAYVHWVRAFIRFHGVRHPATLGSSEVEAFLSWLANERKVSVSTHRQALAALLFFYGKVLCTDLPWLQEIGRPRPSRRLPVVLTPDEVVRILGFLEGEHRLFAQLLYGTGMRISEGLQLRVKDLDFDHGTIIVREGKGSKDRALMLPESLAPSLREQQVAAAQSADNIPAADEGNNRTDWAEVTTGINQSIQDAIARYQGGDAKNAILDIQDTYFDRFEASGMENKIGSRDSAFKTTLEAYFTRLVSLMKAGQPVERLNAEASALTQDLQKAVTMLGEGEETQWSLLLYSLMIIVREGLEALLIVAAIVAYMVKNNHQDKLPLIRQSVIVALIASVITAAIFQMLFTNSGASRELLEGITMLIAVVMLFFMSYWLLSKVEARHWKAWLEGKLSHSLSRGSLVGLWLTSFLAVYREGAETVLFYYALIGDANTVSGHMAIGAGFVIGCVVLLLAWLVMRYSVVRLPLKPFFMFTGSFMYLMAFVFAGKGVLELVEGKLFQPTLINGFPEISWLGIYPYVETLLPQVVLLLAALVALWVMRRKSAVPGETIKNNP